MESRLGASLSPGRKHPMLGTHNRLLRLGARAYLELIAIDPSAPPPARPRWFGLDALRWGEHDDPALLTWVAATSDVRSASGCAVYQTGPVHAMSRGNFNWLITIPDDGALIESGLFPGLIQRSGEGHPCDSLPDVGVALQSLELQSPQPERISSALLSVGFNPRESGVTITASAGASRLRLYLNAPGGAVCFESDEGFANGHRPERD